MNDMRRLMNLIESIENDNEILEEGPKDWIKAGIVGAALAGSPAIADVQSDLNGFADELDKMSAPWSSVQQSVQDAIEDELEDTNWLPSIEKSVIRAARDAQSAQELAAKLREIGNANAMSDSDAEFVAEIDKRIEQTKAQYKAGKISEEDALEMIMMLNKAKSRY